MVLQNREMRLCESRWVSEPVCAVGIAAGGQGLPCKVCAYGCERVQELLAAWGDLVGQGEGGLVSPDNAGVGCGLHLTCTDSSCPGKTD